MDVPLEDSGVFSLHAARVIITQVDFCVPEFIHVKHKLNSANDMQQSKEQMSRKG